MSNSNTVSVTLSPLFLLSAIILSVLKLAGVLNISWAVATAPLWVPITLTLSFLLILALFAGVIYLAFAGTNKVKGVFK